MNNKDTCQVADCKEPVTWESPGYFTKGGPAAKRLGTTAWRICNSHAKVHRAINPFLGWRRVSV